MLPGTLKLGSARICVNREEVKGSPADNGGSKLSCVITSDAKSAENILFLKLKSKKQCKF